MFLYPCSYRDPLLWVRGLLMSLGTYQLAWIAEIANVFTDGKKLFTFFFADCHVSCTRVNLQLPHMVHINYLLLMPFSVGLFAMMPPSKFNLGFQSQHDPSHVLLLLWPHAQIMLPISLLPSLPGLPTVLGQLLIHHAFFSFILGLRYCTHVFSCHIKVAGLLFFFSNNPFFQQWVVDHFFAYILLTFWCQSYQCAHLPCSSSFRFPFFRQASVDCLLQLVFLLCRLWFFQPWFPWFISGSPSTAMTGVSWDFQLLHSSRFFSGFPSSTTSMSKDQGVSAKRMHPCCVEMVG